MIVDQILDSTSLVDVPRQAVAAERAGFGGIGMVETKHDPFVALATAATVTSTVNLATNIAVGFGRTPMTLAMAANDLQQLSRGRFALGIGSQIRPHIENRYSMPWSRPAARMRELVLGVRAIHDSWQNGTALDFKGEFYTHTLMTPMFVPEAHPYGPPPIRVAGVGTRMVEVAGEVSDGLLCHGFSTRRFLDEVTLPALAIGAAKAGRDVADVQVIGAVMVALGETDEEIARAVVATKEQLAFYGSTPAYRGVLEAHGWGDLQDELRALSKQGRWKEMGELITDEMFAELSFRGSPAEIAVQLQARYGDVFARVVVGGVDRPRQELVDELVSEVRKLNDPQLEVAR